MSKNKLIYFYVSFGLALWQYCLPAQAQNEDKVTLERAEVLRKTRSQSSVRKLIEEVVVRHKGTVLYCDSAYLHEDKNKVDAFGNARLIGEDGTRLNSDSMYYDGNTRMARAIGKVVLIDDDTRLTANELDYNMEEGVAYYYTGGKIMDSEKTLTSKTGSYDVNAKVFYFKEEVVLISRNNEKIETNQLTYNTVSKLAFFQGPTWITSSTGKVYTELGNYNTETEASNFKGRTRIEDEKYILEGDAVDFDKKRGIGNAAGNVWMFAKKDSILIEGDVGIVRNEEGFSKVYGNALMRSINKGDTLYLKADTLLSVDKKDNLNKYLLAYPKAQIYNKDFQGKCDSLVYNRIDSTIYFYTDPVLWSEESQLTADSIQILMVNNQVHQMQMKWNAYMISEDTLKNYNQLKGKNMRAYFKENQIRRLEVRGNGQNIYFALEKDTVLVGMNRVECTDMNIYFQAKNKIEKIAYINKPDAMFIPPHELLRPQTKFKNFRWRSEEKPKLNEMLRPAYITLEKKLDKTYIKSEF